MFIQLSKMVRKYYCSTGGGVGGCRINQSWRQKGLSWTCACLKGHLAAFDTDKTRHLQRQQELYEHKQGALPRKQRSVTASRTRTMGDPSTRLKRPVNTGDWGIPSTDVTNSTGSRTSKTRKTSTVSNKTASSHLLCTTDSTHSSVCHPVRAISSERLGP